MYAYYRLAMRKEQEIIKMSGQEYLEYKNGVSAFIPKLSNLGKSVKFFINQ